jgi:hypothetical protein
VSFASGFNNLGSDGFELRPQEVLNYFQVQQTVISLLRKFNAALDQREVFASDCVYCELGFHLPQIYELPCISYMNQNISPELEEVLGCSPLAGDLQYSTYPVIPDLKDNPYLYLDFAKVNLHRLEPQDIDQFERILRQPKHFLDLILDVPKGSFVISTTVPKTVIDDFNLDYHLLAQNIYLSMCYRDQNGVEDRCHWLNSLLRHLPQPELAKFINSILRSILNFAYIIKDEP